MKTIVKATDSDAQIIAKLANGIWHEHYTGIISNGQIDYMLNKFLSVPVIASDISTGTVVYYLLYEDSAAVGYCGISLLQNDIFLSKLYILKAFRKNGFARFVLNFLTDTFKDARYIYLCVNKGNTASIAAYQKMGFEIYSSQIRDIGGGFINDDYDMRLKIER